MKPATRKSSAHHIRGIAAAADRGGAVCRYVDACAERGEAAAAEGGAADAACGCGVRVSCATAARIHKAEAGKYLSACASVSSHLASPEAKLR